MNETNFGDKIFLENIEINNQNRSVYMIILGHIVREFTNIETEFKSIRLTREGKTLTAKITIKDTITTIKVKEQNDFKGSQMILEAYKNDKVN